MAWNLLTALGNMIIFTMLILLTHEHGGGLSTFQRHLQFLSLVFYSFHCSLLPPWLDFPLELFLKLL